jgi:hypothetical protein
MRRQRGAIARSHGREQRALSRNAGFSHDSQQNSTANTQGRGQRVSLAEGLPDGHPCVPKPEGRAREKRLARFTVGKNVARERSERAILISEEVCLLPLVLR